MPYQLVTSGVNNQPIGVYIPAVTLSGDFTLEFTGAALADATDTNTCLLGAWGGSSYANGINIERASNSVRVRGSGVTLYIPFPYTIGEIVDLKITRVGNLFTTYKAGVATGTGTSSLVFNQNFNRLFQNSNSSYAVRARRFKLSSSGVDRDYNLDIASGISVPNLGTDGSAAAALGGSYATEAQWEYYEGSSVITGSSAAINATSVVATGGVVTTGTSTVSLSTSASAVGTVGVLGTGASNVSTIAAASASVGDSVTGTAALNLSNITSGVGAVASAGQAAISLLKVTAAGVALNAATGMLAPVIANTTAGVGVLSSTANGSSLVKNTTSAISAVAVAGNLDKTQSLVQASASSSVLLSAVASLLMKVQAAASGSLANSSSGVAAVMQALQTSAISATNSLAAVASLSNTTVGGVAAQVATTGVGSPVLHNTQLVAFGTPISSAAAALQINVTSDGDAEAEPPQVREGSAGVTLALQSVAASGLAFTPLDPVAIYQLFLRVEALMTGSPEEIAAAVRVNLTTELASITALAAINGLLIGAPAVINDAANTRTAGSISQSIVTNGSTTTVTRLP